MYENEPRSIGGVLDAGIRLYRGAFRRVTLTAAVGFGAIFAVEVLFELAFGVSSASMNTADPETVDPTNALVYLGLLPITVLVTLATSAAIIVHLHRIAAGEPDADAGVYGAGLRRVPAYLGASILYGLAVLVGVLLLLIPGVYLSIALMPGIYLVFTERLGPVAALRRGFALVRGNWWRTATVALVAFFIVFVIQTGIVTLPAAVAGYMAASGEEIGALWFVVLNFLNAVAQSLSAPLAVAMGLAIVRDLVVRDSGEDLEARLDAAGT